MKKKVLSLSIAAMIGGLGYAQSDGVSIVVVPDKDLLPEGSDGVSIVVVPDKDLLPEGSVYYQGVVYTIMLGGWI